MSFHIDRDMIPICHKLGLEPYLDFVVTSAEAGADKPGPAIFLTALQKAGVDAEEAVHVISRINRGTVDVAPGGPSEGYSNTKEKHLRRSPTCYTTRLNLMD